MSFAYYTQFVVNSGQVPSAQSNFPMLLLPNDNRYRTVANGGHVQSGSGYDIRPYSDTGLTSAMTYQLVPGTYNATTGFFEMYVKIPSIATGSTVNLAYGDSGITTDGSSTSTWDSNFKLVCHFPNGTTLNLNDSTSNSNNGTGVNTPTATTGKIDGGVNLASASSQYITAPALGTDFGTNFTVSGWIKRDGTQQAAGSLIADQFAGYVGHAIFWGDPTNGLNSNRLYGGFYDGTAWRYAGMTSDTSDLTWVYAVLTYDGSTIKLYIDGAAPFTSSFSGYTRISGLGTNIGKRWDSGNYVNGTIDEVRYSEATRSADWITTDYNNQSAPSTFYAMGTEVPVSAGSVEQKIFKYKQAVNRASTY